MTTHSNKWYGLTIVEINNLLQKSKISIQDLIHATIDMQKKWTTYNFCHTDFAREALEHADQLDHDPHFQSKISTNKLFGVPYAIKDNFATYNTVTTAGTTHLQNFRPPYEATAVASLKQQQAILMAKTNVDELGMGGTGLYCAFGDVVNPYNPKRVSGGSSSGSAGIVAAGILPFALGTDTGDSIRKPASYCGLVGLKPSYGLISRYGVIPYAPSLDTVGVFTRSVADAAIVLDALAQSDYQDFTNYHHQPLHAYYTSLNKTIHRYKIATLKNVSTLLPHDLHTKYQAVISKIEATYQMKIAEIEFPAKLLGALEAVYIIISYCEAVSCHANLDGINFSTREHGANYREIIKTTNSKHYQKVAQKRLIIGAYALHKANQKKIFSKARKIRNLICQELHKLFQKYDAFLLPGAENIAPLVAKQKHDHQYTKDGHLNFVKHTLVLSNFYGNPSLTLPIGFKDKMPFGININTDILEEQKLLNIAFAIEQLTHLKNLNVMNYETKTKDNGQS